MTSYDAQGWKTSPYSSHDLGQVGHSYSSETSVFLNIKWGWSRRPRICCGSWNEKRSPYARIFEHLVPGLWYCLERLWTLWEVEPCWSKDITGWGWALRLYSFAVLPDHSVAFCLTRWCDFSALCFYAFLVVMVSPNPETRCQNKLSSINRFGLDILPQCPT